MENKIKQLRKMTNKTQREFANTYNIPLSTLKKWEQDESKPAPYVLYLLSNDIDNKNHLIEITDMEHSYYYDDIKNLVYNKDGDCIKVDDNILKVNKNNLLLFLDELFKEYSKIKTDFIIKCSLDNKEKIIWKEFR